MSVKNVVIFSLGAAIGSLVTYSVVRTKFEQIAQEEIESIKKRYSQREWSTKDEVEESEPDESVEDERAKIAADKAREKPGLVEYAAMLQKEGYTDYSAMSNKDEKGEDEDMDEPQYISPEEFDELEDYDTASLSYYADNVLADENDEIVEDLEGTVGINFAEHFGEFEDDSVFVRNNRLKTDFEILLDSRKYTDVVGTASDRGE